MYAITVPVFTRYLNNLDAILVKAGDQRHRAQDQAGGAGRRPGWRRTCTRSPFQVQSTTDRMKFALSRLHPARTAAELGRQRGDDRRPARPHRQKGAGVRSQSFAEADLAGSEDKVLTLKVRGENTQVQPPRAHHAQRRAADLLPRDHRLRDPAPQWRAGGQAGRRSSTGPAHRRSRRLRRRAGGDPLLAGVAISRAGNALLALGRPALPTSTTGPPSSTFLASAQRAAETVGDDHDHYWTSFGPTNLHLHRVAAAVELGDAKHTLDSYRRVARADPRPARSGRRAHHLLDLARAHPDRRPQLRRRGPPRGRSPRPRRDPPPTRRPPGRDRPPRADQGCTGAARHRGSPNAWGCRTDSSRHALDTP